MGGNKAFQVQPGTILGDIIDDARNGFLDADAPAPRPQTPPPQADRPTPSSEEQPPAATAKDGTQEAVDEIVRQGLPDPSDWSEAQLNEQFRCPETLRSDDQQKASVAQTIVWYGKHRKPVTVEGLVKFRVGLLTSHNCTQTLANMARSAD